MSFNYSFAGKIQKWREQLKDLYLLERQEIRFGRRSIDVAGIDDLCVELVLVEEQNKAVGKGRKTGLESDKRMGRSNESDTLDLSENNKLYQKLSNDPILFINALEKGGIQTVLADKRQSRKMLGSYHDMFHLSNHLLLFGAAGTGKTTQINKIAYDWAKHVRDVSSAISSEETVPVHVAMKLVFVLDMHKFQSNQTLSEAVKEQLLPGVSIDDIDYVFHFLRHKCLVIFDGFDEIVKGVTNHALNCTQVRGLFVIVTTRPHMKDKFCRKNKGYTQIQVCGFSSKNAAKYIRKLFDILEVKDLAPSLAAKVVESPLLQTLSSFPVLLVMLCLLWEDTKTQGITFYSMTNLYKEALTEQYLNKPFEDKDEERLPGEEIENVLQILGKTALTALFENKILIKEDHFENRNMLKCGIRLGLVICHDGKLLGDTSVSFIHKTFQEYCAAVYMCRLFDSDRGKFHSCLSEISIDTVNHMEYMLRFCCGLSLKAAAAIFDHVLSVVKTNENSWRLSLILLYEIELSHDPNLVNQYNFHNELKSLCMSTEIDADADLIGAIMHFIRDKNPFLEIWLSKVKSFDSKYRHTSICSIMQILYKMPLLESVTISVQALTNENMTTGTEFTRLTQLELSVFKALHVSSLKTLLICVPALRTLHLAVVQLINDVQYCEKSILLSKSLTELCLMSIDGNSTLDVNVTQLVSFLSCIPALTVVQLHNVHLTDILDVKQVTLSESLKDFTMIGELPDRVYNVSVTQLVSFLSCMPALTEVILLDVHLTGELDTDHVTFSESLKEFVIGGDLPACVYSVSVTQLVSFLSCMPALTKVSLQDVYLTGELGTKQVTLSESLKEFVMAGNLPDRVYSVDVTQLINFFSCMPTLTKVLLQDAYFAGELDDSSVTLSDSLKEFVIIGGLPDRVYNMNVTQLINFLSCMPGLTKVELQDVYLTGESDVNSVTLSESLKEFVMLGCLPDRVYNISVAQLVNFLSCMPGLTKVILQDVHLTGEYDVNSVTLSESLKKFVMNGFLPDRVYNINVTQLINFLSCMPGLTKVSLKDVYLTGELGAKQVTLSESLKEFVMAGNLPDRVYSVDVTQLINFFSCMPTLTKVLLQDAYFAGELDDSSVTLSDSLKEFVIIGCLPDRVYNMNVTQLINFLSCMPGLTKVELQDVYLTGESDVNSVTLSESLKEFEMNGFLPDRVCNINVSQLINFLSCMPALTKVSLQDVHLTDELDDNCVTLNESLKELGMAGFLPDRVYNINVTQLINLLSCMPGLTKVLLQDVHLTGESDVNSVTLSESLKEFEMNGFLPDRVCNINVSQLINFLSCMPALTKVSLQDVYLTGELGAKQVTLSESLKEFVMSGNLPDRVYSVDVTQLINFFSCMPTLTKVLLQDAYFAGELDDNSVTLSDSLKEFVIKGFLPDRVYNISVTQLINFLSCMPGLTKVLLQDVYLTGELDAKQVTSSESLKEFKMNGCLPDRVYNIRYAYTYKSATSRCLFCW